MRLSLFLLLLIPTIGRGQELPTNYSAGTGGQPFGVSGGPIFYRPITTYQPMRLAGYQPQAVQPVWFPGRMALRAVGGAWRAAWTPPQSRVVYVPQYQPIQAQGP